MTDTQVIVGPWSGAGVAFSEHMGSTPAVRAARRVLMRRRLADPDGFRAAEFRSAADAMRLSANRLELAGDLPAVDPLLKTANILEDVAQKIDGAPAEQPTKGEQDGQTEVVDRRRRERNDRERNERLNRRAAWRSIPMAERQRIALTLIADNRLTIRELHDRMTAELPECNFHDSDTRNVVRRLFEERELDRQGERWRKGDSVRYRYFRRSLDGPIADLVCASHDGRET